MKYLIGRIGERLEFYEEIIPEYNPEKFIRSLHSVRSKSGIKTFNILQYMMKSDLEKPYRKWVDELAWNVNGIISRYSRPQECLDNPAYWLFDAYIHYRLWCFLNNEDYTKKYGALSSHAKNYLTTREEEKLVLLALNYIHEFSGFDLQEDNYYLYAQLARYAYFDNIDVVTGKYDGENVIDFYDESVKLIGNLFAVTVGRTRENSVEFHVHTKRGITSASFWLKQDDFIIKSERILIQKSKFDYIARQNIIVMGYGKMQKINEQMFLHGYEEYVYGRIQRETNWYHFK